MPEAEPQTGAAPAPEPAEPPPSSGRGTPPRAPGLVDQLRRTIAAGRRLVDAHLGLAKAELSTILADAQQVALQAGIALALVVFVGVLVPVGTTLFVGEWLFGSIGWGVLHGAELSIALAVLLVLGALDVPRPFLVRMLAVAVAIGGVVGAAFGLAATNYAWTSLGDAILPGIEPGVRPLVTAILVSGIALGVVGLIVGARTAAPSDRVGAAFGGLLAGVLAGVAPGAFTAIAFAPEVGIAIGVAVTLALWPALSAAVLRDYDWEQLQTRFYPSATIETTQETIAWLQQFQERMRPGKRS